MKKITGVLILLLLVRLTILVTPALAHGSVGRQEEHQAGPYRFQITFDVAPAQTDQELHVSIYEEPGRASLVGTTITMIGRPDAGTSSTATRVSTFRVVSGQPISYDGNINFVSQGTWLLEVKISGPAGIGQTEISVQVKAPPAIPVWLGWLIGCLPLFGLAWFAWWNRQYLVRLKQEQETALA